ncbi:hypothetical protein J1614_010360 [Plenodomus biglobosus]|nr:hypothetical protein J1614_010360 [Plenodomus biglobosus]
MLFGTWQLHATQLDDDKDDEDDRDDDDDDDDDDIVFAHSPCPSCRLPIAGLVLTRDRSQPCR